MKYLCLVYLSPEAWSACPDSTCAAYAQKLTDNGKLSTTDGPFAETKEQLGGYYLIEARDLNDAIQVASKIPSVRIGSIEVRPIMEFTAAP